MAHANHGNTPAAWTAVAIALAGFVVGGIGLLFNEPNWVVFWVGVALAVGSLLVFVIMDRLGFHGENH